MALSITNKSAGTVTTASSTAFTMSSVAWTSGKLYILSAWVNPGNGATVSMGTPTAAFGLTWAKIGNDYNNGASRWNGALYTAYADSGVSTGSVVVNFTASTSATRETWHVYEVTGSAATAANNGSDAIANTNRKSATESSSTFAIPNNFVDPVNNASVAFLMANTNATQSGKTGFTANTNVASGMNDVAEYFIGQDLAPSVTWDGTSVAARGIAFELLVPQSIYVGMIPI